MFRKGLLTVSQSKSPISQDCYLCTRREKVLGEECVPLYSLGVRINTPLLAGTLGFDAPLVLLHKGTTRGGREPLHLGQFGLPAGIYSSPIHPYKQHH